LGPRQQFRDEALPLWLLWRSDQGVYLLALHGQPLPETHPFGALRASYGPLLDRMDIHIEVPHSPHWSTRDFQDHHSTVIQSRLYFQMPSNHRRALTHASQTEMSFRDKAS
jgi:hypothetical protein